MSEGRKDEKSFDPARLEKVRDTIADTIHAASRTICDQVPSEHSDASAGSGGPVDWALQTSQWLDRWSDELRQWDVRESEAKVRASIVAHPGRMLLLAGAVGIVLSNVLRRR